MKRTILADVLVKIVDPNERDVTFYDDGTYKLGEWSSYAGEYNYMYSEWKIENGVLYFRHIETDTSNPQWNEWNRDAAFIIDSIMSALLERELLTQKDDINSF